MRLTTTRRFHSSIFLSALLILGATGVAQGAARLPGFFTDNMVLQREMPVPVWGWADSNEEVTVTFAGQSHTAKAGADGRWQVRLDPMAACAEPTNLVIKASNEITLRNVVVGEVWLCSGQSNMEWVLANSRDAAAEVAAANFPLIRQATKGGYTQACLPQSNVASTWQVCSPQTAGGFTAVGYFFGRKLHQELGVPIGLLNMSWGGTAIEPWTPRAALEADPETRAIADSVMAWDPSTPTGKQAHLAALAAIRDWLPRAEAAMAEGQIPPVQPLMPGDPTANCQLPTKIYNAMIHPLVPYAIRGAIWYQGESNAGHGPAYLPRLRALIQGWRQAWGQGDFPFYIAQLANFTAPSTDPAGGDGWAGVRDAMRRALALPNTGLAVLIDIGEAYDIHPRNKQDVGLRLALWALAKTYGQKDLVCSGPLYREMAVENGAVRLSFDYVGGGLMVGQHNGTNVVETAEAPLSGFAVAGEDKKWAWAEARLDGSNVVVSCADVPAPVAVRYAYRANPQGCNLYNREGLPASPFRTDDW